DGEARPVLEQLRPQVVDLRHRQAAVIGDEQRVGLAQPVGQLGDQPLLVFFLHLLTSSKSNRARTQAGSLRRRKPLHRSASGRPLPCGCFLSLASGVMRELLLPAPPPAPRRCRASSRDRREFLATSYS